MSTDITAIKSDLEQLSEVKTDMKTLLENQQPILQLLQSNLTAMSRLGKLELFNCSHRLLSHLVKQNFFKNAAPTSS